MTPLQRYNKVQSLFAEIDSKDYKKAIEELFEKARKELIKLRKESGLYDITSRMSLNGSEESQCINDANYKKELMKEDVLVKNYLMFTSLNSYNYHLKKENFDYTDYHLVSIYQGFIPVWLDDKKFEETIEIDRTKLTIKFKNFISYMKYRLDNSMKQAYAYKNEVKNGFNQIQAFHVLCYGEPSQEMFDQFNALDNGEITLIDLFNSKGNIQIIRNSLGKRQSIYDGSCVLKFPDEETLDKIAIRIGEAWEARTKFYGR